MTPLDAQRLDEAIALAHQAIGLSDPNPRVGCVIGREDGTVLGQGSTQRAGEAHAEVMALRDAAGSDLRGATAWVSLEPCSHHGRTPPCCDALVAAGIGRVVMAVGDPNPRVNGQGQQRLRAAGLRVDLGEPRHALAARELNIGFFSRHERGRPWLRLKTAASLDGRTALQDGTSQWITGAEARADGHAWRRRAGAVVTGIGTVLHDDPRLDVRLVPTTLQPLRVVVDSALRLPPQARVLPVPGHALVVSAGAEDQRATRLRAAGAEVMALPGADGRFTSFVETPLPPMTQGQWGKLIDANSDGKLSKEEFLKGAKEENKAKMETGFAAKDKDKDGNLTLEEFKAGGKKKKADK